MASEQTEAFEIHPNGDGISILIKPRSVNPYSVLGLVAALIIGWGLYNSVRGLGQDPEAVTGVLFLGSVEAALLLVMLREVVHREVLEVQPDSLTIRREPRLLFLFQPPHSYDAREITPLQVGTEAGFKIGLPSQPGPQHSAIIFEHDGHEVHFGSGLDADEANLLIDAITNRYPAFRKRSSSKVQP